MTSLTFKHPTIPTNDLLHLSPYEVPEIMLGWHWHDWEGENPTLFHKKPFTSICFPWQGVRVVLHKESDAKWLNHWRYEISVACMGTYPWRKIEGETYDRTHDLFFFSATDILSAKRFILQNIEMTIRKIEEDFMVRMYPLKRALRK